MTALKTMEKAVKTADITLSPEQDAIARQLSGGIDKVETFLELGEVDLNDKKLTFNEGVGLAINAPSAWGGITDVANAVRACRKFDPATREAIRAKAAEYTVSPDNSPTRVSLVIDYVATMGKMVDSIISTSAKLLNAVRAIKTTPAA